MTTTQDMEIQSPKYYLLTFCEDWADEHNVPALNCFTEEQYNEWLKSPSGKINDNYSNMVELHNNAREKYEAFIKKLEEKGLYTKSYRDYTDEERVWFKANNVPRPGKLPVKVDSYVRAYLGNSGENFGENFNSLYLMEEFVEQGIVRVFEVSKDFYDTFHGARLSSLSLSNVFEIEF